MTQGWQRAVLSTLYLFILLLIALVKKIKKKKEREMQRKLMSYHFSFIRHAKIQKFNNSKKQVFSYTVGIRINWYN